MLVLLIIFLITIPVVTTSIPVELPKERNEIRETKPENIVLSVDQAGSIYWNDLKLANTDALIDRLKKIAVLTPQPEVQIRGDGRGEYAGVGRIIYAVPARRDRQGRLHHRAAARAAADAGRRDSSKENAAMAMNVGSGIGASPMS